MTDNQTNTIGEKLKKHFNDIGITQEEAAKRLNVSQANISALLNKKPFGKKLAQKWGEEFGIQPSWLLTGEGEMLKESNKTNNEEKGIQKSETILTGKLIPFYDVDTAAGTQYGMNMEPARQAGMIEIGSVLRDSESAIRVYGNSMIPNYPAGCVIGLKLHTDSFIEPGRVYVVETHDNRYLKRLYYNDDHSAFHCLSDNQMKYEEGARKGKLYYQDFEIPLNEVIRLHRVIGVIKRNVL